MAFKVDSRYLEHTLTRDNVLREDHFDKVMGWVDRIVRETLPDHLFERLEAGVAAPEQAGHELAASWEQAGTLLVQRRELAGRMGGRVLFRTLDGQSVSLGQAARIPGITCADVALLMVHLKARRAAGVSPSS